MKGFVDDSGRAILPIQTLCTNHPDGVQVNAWIDTGFTGDFVLPSSVIEYLELEATGSFDGVSPGSDVNFGFQTFVTFGRNWRDRSKQIARPLALQIHYSTIR